MATCWINIVDIEYKHVIDWIHEVFSSKMYGGTFTNMDLLNTSREKCPYTLEMWDEITYIPFQFGNG